MFKVNDTTQLVEAARRIRQAQEREEKEAARVVLPFPPVTPKGLRELYEATQRQATAILSDYAPASDYGDTES